MTDLTQSQPLIFQAPITLVGGGSLSQACVERARVLAPHLIAADGAADRLSDWGLMPEAVIGDMDSVADPGSWAGRQTQFLSIAEQDTTDFEKCLYATEAPLYVAAGFTGRRVDHMLAVFHAMLARPEKRVVLLGEHDVMAFLPPDRTLEFVVGQGSRVSFFPFLSVSCRASSGLKWPVDGLHMQPGQQSGTSNQATANSIVIDVDGPGLLLILPPEALTPMIDGLWPGMR